MSDRQLFLDRLRSRLTDGAPPNVAHPLPSAPPPATVRYARDLSDPVTAFVAAAEATGSVVRRLTPDGLAGLLDEVCDTHDVTSAICTSEPAVAGASEHLDARGVTVLTFDGPATTAQAELGVTGVRAAVAATGSLVVDAGLAGGRTASLLPPVHLALVRAEEIVATAADLLAGIDRPPSQLVFITGPSRSADIEFTLTIGVHGPRHVWIGVLE